MRAGTLVQLLCGSVLLGCIALRPWLATPSGLPPLLCRTALAATALLCAWAAHRDRRRRLLLASWALLALANAAAALRLDQALGHVLDPVTAYVGPRLCLGVAYLPLGLIALWLLVSEGAPRWIPRMWGDAAIVGLGTTAAGVFAVAVLAQPLASSVAQPPTLTPELADVVVIALILAVSALSSSRRAAVGWVSAGLLVMAGGDVIRLLAGQRVAVSSRPVMAVSVVLGCTVIGVGARNRPGTPLRREHRARPRISFHLGPLPWAACGVSAGVLAAAALGAPVPPFCAVLALGSLCAALLRVGLTLAELDGGSSGAGARTDELTGLANRRALSEALANREALSEALAGDDADSGQDDGKSEQHWSGWTDRIALLLVDLDSFKDINEALGHDVGDKVLAKVGARLRTALRLPQLLARLGGDEFAVVLPGAGREAATEVAESLCAVLAEPVELDGHRLHVRASVGVATCLIPHEEPGDLLRQADVALNRAKAGGSTLEVYDPTLDLRTAHRLMRIDELRSALERGDLEVYLQPQVDLVDGAVVGAEALARWRHPQDGVLLPEAFLPLAAQTGLMRPVAALVLDRALDACAHWWRRGYRIPVSVNLTADDLRDAGMSRRISESLAQHDLPAQALRIELTEDVLLTDPSAAGALLQSWRRAGIAVAVDDFGTGYSSLGYLRELPLDELKLDRSFVADLRRRTTVTIVRHTIAMAHGLGMRVVAEGVEDQATARALADAGCDVGQGLYFGAATASATFLEQLEQSQL